MIHAEAGGREKVIPPYPKRKVKRDNYASAIGVDHILQDGSAVALHYQRGYFAI